MTMNVDFSALSSAVQQANNQPPGSSGVRNDNDNSARKVPARRRTSLGNSSSTLQFLEAAQQSWNFAQDAVPAGETPAYQRRKSLRADIADSQDKFDSLAHKSFPSLYDRLGYGDASPSDGTLTKAGSSKQLNLPGGGRTKRRASLGSVVLEEEASVKEEANADKNEGRRGRLTRRSSLRPDEKVRRSPKQQRHKKPPATRRFISDPVQPTKDQMKELKAKLKAAKSRVSATDRGEGEPPRPERKKLPVRRFVSDPVIPSGKQGRRRSVRHDSSSMGMDDSGSSLSKSSRNNRRASMATSPSNQGVKGTVRFELDHKNRIKRRVSVIRKQNARTHDSALWWSQEELDRIYERENKVYEKWADNRSYKRKIQKLWGSCSKANSGNKLSPEAIAHVAGSPSRGLEVDILEVVRDRRARVIGSLLDAQETLRDLKPDVRTKVLSARYRNLCKAASRFARKMGEGDEMEAANIYSPTSSPSASKE